MTPHRCPVCEGHGVVGYPPGTPAGQPFTGSSTGPWECRPCGGTGIVWSSESFRSPDNTNTIVVRPLWFNT